MSVRSALNKFKGKMNAAIDKFYQLYRRARQIKVSLKNSEPQGSFIHLLCVSRVDYIQPTIKCLNSFWEFNSHFSACIWLDETTSDFQEQILSKLDRSDRVIFKRVPNPDREWQWNKLLIILEHMNQSDIFCDADIIWNGPIPIFQSPTFFLKEFDLNSRAATRHLNRSMGLSDALEKFMFNVSLVQLREWSQNPRFVSLAREFYGLVRNVEADSIIGQGDVPSIKRMAEQIAISLAIQEVHKGKISVLKTQDYVMDGGVAESYYLGSSSGWQ